MKFQIVVPTYKRPAKLERFFNSLINQKLDEAYLTENQTGVSLYVYFDNDDKESHEYFKNKFGSFFLSNYILLEEQNRAFGIWNKHLKGLDVDAMFYVCDDIEFKPDCLMTAIKEFATRYPDTDGVVGLNQENIAKNKDGFSRNAMGIIGKKFAERYPERKCFCPDYTSFHADAELGNFARSLGKFYFAENAEITHYHPAYYKDQLDETHNIVRTMKDVDREIWNVRQKRNLLWGQSFDTVR
jgi:glycosyltransferase involved in cell wall biosynthesis